MPTNQPGGAFRDSFITAHTDHTRRLETAEPFRWHVNTGYGNRYKKMLIGLMGIPFYLFTFLLSCQVCYLFCVYYVYDSYTNNNNSLL